MEWMVIALSLDGVSQRSGEVIGRPVLDGEKAADDTCFVELRISESVQERGSMGLR